MNTADATRKEWNELGFYYEHDKGLNQWRIFGTIAGFKRFAQLFADYASRPCNDSPGEHDHVGPYMYLKIMTWSAPVINADHIAGTMGDLKRLSDILFANIREMMPGEIRKIGAGYTGENSGTIVLLAMSDRFLPSMIEMD